MRNPGFFNLKSALGFFCALAFIPISSYAQNVYTQLPLNDLSAFKTPPTNWSIAGSVKGNLDKPFEKQAGQGILVNEPNQKKNEDIFTNLKHGDINLDVDFMMPPGSNSGIYLQGRYEIQLLDSWAKDTLTSQDLGSVYERWDETRPNGDFGYQGIAPRVNVSRAPGLWQNIKISFLAPKFDASGKKIANARIIQIVLNGVVIIENAELTGPTRGSAFPNEAAMGPLRLQGDHGAVAFRSIKYNNTVTTTTYDPDAPKHVNIVESPSFVEVKDEPIIQRSFVNFGEKMVTHAASVGYPHHLNFAYDLENGTVFQIWRGAFIDATPMWWFRGDGTSKALGSVIPLNDAPALATLNPDNAAWPDSLNIDYRPKGYELDKQGYPTFKYIAAGLNVADKVTQSPDGKMLMRQITFNGSGQGNLYYRVASAKNIDAIGNGMYSVNNYEYYLQLPKGNKPVLRATATGQELLLPVKDTDKGATIEYSMIW